MKSLRLIFILSSLVSVNAFSQTVVGGINAISTSSANVDGRGGMPVLFTDTLSDNYLIQSFSFSPLVSIQEYQGNDPLQVFPNPTTGTIFFDCAFDLLFVLDITGQEICQFNDNQLIDISDLPKGIYILKIKQEEQFYTRKILKL